MIAPALSYRLGVYTFQNEDEANLAFQIDKRLRSFVVPIPWITHWKRDYRVAAGVIRLGHTVIKNVVMVQPQNRAKPTVEFLVRCEEGYLSREEAIGSDWVPTMAEIEEGAKSIRRHNDSIGNLKRPETVGFDLLKVYSYPTV